MVWLQRIRRFASEVLDLRAWGIVFVSMCIGAILGVTVISISWLHPVYGPLMAGFAAFFILVALVVQGSSGANRNMRQ